MNQHEFESLTQPVLVYDDECPLCRNYARKVRLENTIGKVILVNAREENHPIVIELRNQSFCLDQGMVFIYRGQCYYGADAMHFIALISSKHGVLNRLIAWLFSSKALAKLLYPLLRLGRRVLLLIRGKSQMSY